MLQDINDKQKREWADYFEKFPVMSIIKYTNKQGENVADYKNQQTGTKNPRRNENKMIRNRFTLCRCRLHSQKQTKLKFLSITGAFFQTKTFSKKIFHQGEKLCIILRYFFKQVLIVSGSSNLHDRSDSEQKKLQILSSEAHRNLLRFS